MGHPTEEHEKQIKKEEIQPKEKAPLASALDTFTQLDRRPSSRETIDFVNKPVEEWLKNPKTHGLKNDSGRSCEP